MTFEFDRDYARLLGLAMPTRRARRPHGTSEHAAFVRSLKQNAQPASQLSETTKKAVTDLLADVHLDVAAPWMYFHWKLAEQDDDQHIVGICITSAAPLGFGPGSISSTRLSLPYAWTDRHRSYEISLIGREIQSNQEEQECPEETLWMLQLGDEVVTQIASLRARAFRPGDPVFAQTEWQPGQSVVERSYRGDLPGDTSAAKIGLELLLDLQPNLGGRRRVDRATKIGKLAEAGLKWYDANHTAARYVRVEDCGRPELGEATGRGTKGVNDHMNRAPKVFNLDVRQRMHEMIEERKSAR